MEKDTLEKIFLCAEEFLTEIRPENVVLDQYLIIKRSFSSLTDINAQMFETLQNRAMAPKVIKFDKNKPELMKILFDFNVHSILRVYTKESLFEKFKERFIIKNVESPSNLWRKYAESIISACEFMKDFSDEKEFDEFVNIFMVNEKSRAALPLLMAQEIKGLGFVLACNFLKELGYTKYSKPDVHLIDVFNALNICDANEYEVYKAVNRMADACGKTAFYIDKVLWLICSGKYYLDGIEIKGRKKELIERIHSTLEEKAYSHDLQTPVYE